MARFFMGLFYFIDIISYAKFALVIRRIDLESSIIFSAWHHQKQHSMV